jgi:hypothetical protein
MFHGGLLTESLRIGVDIVIPQMRLTRCCRHDVSDSTPPGEEVLAWSCAAGTPEHQLDWRDS